VTSTSEGRNRTISTEQKKYGSTEISELSVSLFYLSMIFNKSTLHKHRLIRQTAFSITVNTS